MKLSLHLLMIISIISGIFPGNEIIYSRPSQSSDNGTISGMWLGELRIPNTADLRMGVTISKTGNDAYSAVLNIIDQATGDIPCDKVISRNDSVIILIKGLGIEIAGATDKESKTIKSEFRQGGGVFPVIFAKVERLPELKRPQEPVKPYPYNEENVVFENKKGGIRLAGTLTVPKSKGRFPAVVLVTGSGQQNRDEEVGKHKPFWILADYLTRNGIAVLRVDDRGIGGSTGNFERSTTGDFADDALAAIAYLKTRPEILSGKIGLIGHSEGGTVSALAASNSGDIAFIVSMAGGFVNFEDIVLDQITDQLRMEGRNDEDIQLECAWRKSIYSLAREKTDSATAAKKLWEQYDKLTPEEVKRLNWPRGRQTAQIGQVLNPWWRYILGMDNKKILFKVDCPMLALYGDLDQQVNPAKNIQIIEAAKKEAGRNNITIEKLTGLNHLFQTAKTGSEYEYTRIEETISPVALARITDWIQKNTR